MKFNIDKIVEEWSYRVDNGIPDAKNPLHIVQLRDLLREYKITENVIDMLINNLSEARRKISDISPDKAKFVKNYKWLKGSQSEKFYDSIEKNKKLDDFSKFMKALPSGDATKKTKEALNSFSDGEIEEFVNFLWSIVEPKAGNLPSSKAAEKLFDLKPDGAGRGEIYLAALCKNSFIQGSGKSFDLQTKNNKYEVKDYSKLGGSIRAGVEAAISKFVFWKEILKTIDIIQDIEEVDGWSLFPEHPSEKELVIVKDYIIKRISKDIKIVTGEYNKTDHKYMQDFYNIINKIIDVKTKDFNQIVLRGPNQKPKSFTIKPLSPNIPKKGALSIELFNSQGDIEQLINYLKRLKYVRDPKKFTEDINDALKEIIEKGDADYWIIFRKSKMKIIAAKANNFQYETISQNGVKFKEV